MLVTGNGVLIVVEDENDLWSDILDALRSIPDALEDEIAEHALDTICFLQDEDVATPMDELAESPMAFGGIAAWLEWME